MRPVLRYHGGKWNLAKWIISHFPKHGVYCEPFGGSASVLIQKPKAYCEIYNDLDGQIVNIFRVLRDPGKAARLLRALKLTPYAREEFQLSYEYTEDLVERARRTIFRSFAGHGSDSATRQDVTGFRAGDAKSNRYMACEWKNYPEHLPKAIDRLREIIIENLPAIECIRKYDSADTLFYVDPPYVPETRCPRGVGRSYRHDMSREDHVALANIFKNIEGMVVLSGYPSKLYNQLYAGWIQIETSAVGQAYTGGKVNTEVLWLSPKCKSSLPLFQEQAS